MRYIDGAILNKTQDNIKIIREECSKSITFDNLSEQVIQLLEIGDLDDDRIDSILEQMQASLIERTESARKSDYNGKILCAYVECMKM